MTEEHRNSDELELIDLFRVFWKYKAVTLLVPVLLSLGATGGSYLFPDIYEVTSIIEPGKRLGMNGMGGVVEEGPLVSPETIMQTVLGGAYDESIREKLQIEADDYPEIEVDVPKKTSLVNITIESANPEQALAVMSEIVNKIVLNVSERFEPERRKIQSKIARAKVIRQSKIEQAKLLKSQLSETSLAVHKLESTRRSVMVSRPSDTMAALLYSNELKVNQIYLNQLNANLKAVEEEALVAEIEIERLQEELEGLISALVHKRATISSEPVSPKRVMIAGVVFFIAFLATVIFVFALDYVLRVKALEGANGY